VAMTQTERVVGDVGKRGGYRLCRRHEIV
jgi:hypothetical protein